MTSSKEFRQPPKWVTRLLRWLHPSDTLEEVEGDLVQLYAYWYVEDGKRKATMRYLWSVLSVLPPFVRRRKQKKESNQLSHHMMLRSYLTQFARSTAKDKTYAFLNIIGLSAGLTCFAFIALWVKDELSYDKFNQNYDRIVRLTQLTKTETGFSHSAGSGAALAKVLKEDHAEVENTLRLDMKKEEMMQYKSKQWLQPSILLADPSFFDVFSYPLTRGNVETALQEPYQVVLTESTAKKYFGDEDPIGQALTIYMYDREGNGASYTVTGITPDPPKNAHFSFNLIASFKTIEVANPDVLSAEGWGDNDFYTYLLLKKGVVYETFSAKIEKLTAKNPGEKSANLRSTYSYQLQPLSDIHLFSHLKDEIAPTGNINQVYIFSTIGIFILLLAGINYTNFATARSARRAKEVGIKKVVGADKTQLIVQYLLESVLISILALLFSWLLSFLLQPFFYELTGKDLSLFSSPQLLLFLTGISILLGVLSGLYPAFVLSAFKPVSILKGSFQSSTKGVWLRQSLVISQFVITLILITGIVIIYAQMSYIKHKDLGYDKDALLFLQAHGNMEVINGYGAFKNELSSNPLISGVATSRGFDDGSSQTIDSQGKPIEVSTSILGVNASYFDVYGIKLAAGRNFRPGASGESLPEFIVNERAVKEFGWIDAADAIGKPFILDGKQGRVIGVIKDFHFEVLHQPITPLAIYLWDQHFSRITLKIDMGQASQSLAFIEKVWAKHFPAALFDFHFADLQLEAQYQSEERFSRIILYFSILSLLIACLGLYGLIAYSAAQKTKEISIRKVLGATVDGIAMLLTKEFVKPLMVACLIAIPIAWYVMNEWLQDFAYRIDIKWWMFAASVVPVLLTALLTISYQAIKAALVNPIKTLRSE
jgi:ABC-type antimicrobial peptide transport system permease subunit